MKNVTAVRYQYTKGWKRLKHLSYAERACKIKLRPSSKAKELNKEIERLQEKWLNAQRQDDELIRKSRQYDDIQFHLYGIHQRQRPMRRKSGIRPKNRLWTLFCVIDDIKEAVAVFQQDLKALKKDLEIGSDTLEDRVTSFLYSLESFENTLDQIKLRFYQDNHLPWEKPEPLEK